MKRKQVAVGGISALLAIGVACAYMAKRAMAGGIPAQQPMSYSGVLTDTAGVPLTGSKNMTIQFWDQETNGALLCFVGPSPVTLVAGGFRIPLGNDCTAAIHATQDVWVEVRVDSTVLGRTKLGAVPYAVEADSVGGKTASVLQNYANLTNLPPKCAAGQYLDGNGTCHAETDPKVGSTVKNAVPHWSGTKLVDGTIEDDGTHAMVGATAAQANARMTVSSTVNAADVGLYTEGGSGSAYSGGYTYGKGIIARGYYAGDFAGGSYGVYATGGSYGVYGTVSGSSGYGVFGSAPSGAYAGYFSGDVTVAGNFTVSGTKSAIVQTASSGKTLVYNQESTEVWLEDFGSGRLTKGRADVTFDPKFLETVTIDEEHPCKVFVTANGNTAPLYVEKDLTGFRVIESSHGRSNATFDWRVVGKRRGYESLRLEPGR